MHNFRSILNYVFSEKFMTNVFVVLLEVDSGNELALIHWPN